MPVTQIQVDENSHDNDNISVITDMQTVHYEMYNSMYPRVTDLHEVDVHEVADTLEDEDKVAVGVPVEHNSTTKPATISGSKR